MSRKWTNEEFDELMQPKIKALEKLRLELIPNYAEKKFKKKQNTGYQGKKPNKFYKQNLQNK